MANAGGGLRLWLTGLHDAELRELLLLPGPLPYACGVGTSRSGGALHAGRREILRARAWLGRATAREIKSVAQFGVAYAEFQLTQVFGFEEQDFKEPEPSTLARIFGRLEPVLAQLAMYGMVSGQHPSGPLVAEHWDELLRAAQLPGGTSEDDDEDGVVADDEAEGRSDDVTDGRAGDVTERNLADRTAALEGHAGSLIEVLQEAVARIDAGREFDSTLAGQLAVWARQRAELTTWLAAGGHTWAADDGFAELGGIAEELRARTREAEERAAECAKLTEQRDQLRAVLDAAPPGAPHVDPLRQSVALLEERIAELSAPPEAAVREAAVREPGVREPAAPEAAAPEAPAEQVVRPEPAVAVETGLRDGPEVRDAPPVVPAPRNVTATPDVAATTSEPDAGDDVPEAHTDAEAGEPSAAPEDSAPEQAPEPGAGDDVPEPVTDAEASEPPPVHEDLAPETPEPGAGDDVPETHTDADANEPPAVREDQAPEPAPVAEPAPPGLLPWSALDPTTAALAHLGPEDPAPVARLVLDGRLTEAYWLTAGSAEPAHRAQCLAFAAAAFSCRTGEEAAEVMTGFDPDLDALQSDRPALTLAVVASLRASLLAGWPNDLIIQTDPAVTTLPGPWVRLVARAAEVLRHYQRLDPAVTWLGPDSEPLLSRESLAEEAAVALADLPRQRIGYNRATQVKSRLLQTEQPLGKALATVAAWAGGRGRATELDEIWELFRKRGAAERMIEEADAAIRTPKQAREPIEAAAKRALLRCIGQVSDLVSRSRALAAPAVDERTDTVVGLRHALDAVRGSEPPSTVEGAAAFRLFAWLLGEDRPATLVPVTEHGERHPGDGDGGGDRPGSEPLLAAASLPRSPDGEPLPDEPGFAEAVLTLLGPVETRAVLRTYVERGDLHLADLFVAALEQDRVPAVPAGLDSVPSGWRQLRDAEWTRWQNAHREAHRVAYGLLAELRTQQNLSPQTERALDGRLEQLSRTTPEGAFGQTIADLRSLEGELRARVAEYVQRLRGSLGELNLPAEDEARLIALLEAGDTVTAEECLALLRKGDPLPDWSGTDWGAELAQFAAGMEAPPRTKPGPRGYSARPWAERFLDGKPLTEAARSALGSWEALCRPQTLGSEWQRHVPSVLSLLGLECRQTPVREHRRQVVGVLRLTARVTSGGTAPGYVAALGSAASAFTILVVSNEQRGRSPLELLDSSDTGACLIIYLYPLGLQGRRDLAAQARTSSQQALVVDPAVFGWVAARSPHSFRAAQRVTLPWTAFNPYTPFVAGLVPPEVFYGRSREMATVTDPLGALFLYGGRQLGKSALLRKVEATFPSNPLRKAVYLDLKARGVGEAEPAERIWRVLANELKRVGVLGAKVSSEVGPDVLLSKVQEWLEEDQGRRVLVLADEADAFLTADSKPVPGRGGEATFPNVLRLKGLMDRTDRRFKVVFAGLHQVQRFSHLSNVPLTHGGPDVLIGPLKPAEAQRLVVEPMAAFGYRFERPELVWRVLAATNYQACLVQIFCEQLVVALRQKPLGSARWPAVVTEEDVRAVANSESVHRHIAERLRITINLEDRYRVLALVIALRSQMDGFNRGYRADELLSMAKQHWREGFTSLTASDVQIYLDEMEGLGLLIRQADRRHYAVRSPNVVHMLGTREDLELELRQTEFDLPYDYNPRFSRRFVGHDAQGISRYSPLTEHQLHQVTGAGVSVVGLAAVYGPQLVSAAVRSYSEARGLQVRPATVKNLADVLAEAARERRHSVILADLHGCDGPALDDCVRRLHAHVSRPATNQHRAAVLLVDPVLWDGRADERVTTVVHPERWSADSLRAWPECPFDTPDKRRRLVEVTGGWPNLVERTVHRTSREGATLEAALQRTDEFTATVDAARGHLARVNLDDSLVKLLTGWTGYVDPGEGANVADIASVTGLAPADVHTLMRRLTELGVLDDGDDGYALDRVTFRALTTLRDAPVAGVSVAGAPAAGRRGAGLGDAGLGGAG